MKSLFDFLFLLFPRISSVTSALKWNLVGWQYFSIFLRWVPEIPRYSFYCAARTLSHTEMKLNTTKLRLCKTVPISVPKEKFFLNCENFRKKISRTFGSGYHSPHSISSALLPESKVFYEWPFRYLLVSALAEQFFLFGWIFLLTFFSSVSNFSLVTNGSSGNGHQGDGTTAPYNTFGLKNSIGEIKKLDRISVKGKDIILSSLKDCQIIIDGCASTLNCENLSGCTVISGPIKTSVFLTNCQNCTLAVACQQLRIHDSGDLRCYVHLTSGGIIERCKNILVAPYTVSYPNMDEDFLEAGLSKNPNDNWEKIEDFDYLVSKKRSPNWNIIPETERLTFSTWRFISFPSAFATVPASVVISSL